MSSSVCLVVTSRSCSIVVLDLIFSFLRASNKDKDLEQSDVIVCLEDSFTELKSRKFALKQIPLSLDLFLARADGKRGDVPYGIIIVCDGIV